MGESDGETATATASGRLTVADVDGDDLFVEQTNAATAHGTVALAAAGAWTYTPDDAHETVNALDTGDQLADSFTAVAADGTEQVVEVVIQGADDIVMSTPNADVLLGRGGADVLDGRGGTDAVDLSAIDADRTTAGNDAFAFTGGADFSGRAGELRFVGGMVHGDTNGDGRTDLVAELSGVTDVIVDDFNLQGPKRPE